MGRRGTRLPRPILYHAWHTAVWMTVFMGGIFIVLWLVSLFSLADLGLFRRHRCRRGSGGAGGRGRGGDARSSDAPPRKESPPGVKILISGGTRCNLTHATDKWGIIRAYGDQGNFLHSALAALSPTDLVKLIEDESVPTKVEESGKIFRSAIGRRMFWTLLCGDWNAAVHSLPPARRCSKWSAARRAFAS